MTSLPGEPRILANRFSFRVFRIFRGLNCWSRDTLNHYGDKTAALLEDPEREFVAATFLKLELLPQPTFHRRRAELEFLWVEQLTATKP